MNQKNQFKYNYKIVTICLIVLTIVQFGCAVSQITPTPFINTPTIINTITNTATIESTITKTIINSKYVIVTNCNFLNIRKFGNENSQILNTIPVGTKIQLLEVVESIQDNVWYEIQFENIIGYVKGEFVEFAP